VLGAPAEVFTDDVSVTLMSLRRWIHDLPGSLQKRNHRADPTVVVAGFGQVEFGEDAAHVFSMVPSATHSSRPMPALERPSAIKASTSRSRVAQHGQRIVTASFGHQVLDEFRVDHGAPSCDALEAVDEVGYVPDAAFKQIAGLMSAFQEVHCVLDFDVCR
jgi:hypothetical protein